MILAMLSQHWMFKNGKYKNLGENLYWKKKLFLVIQIFHGPEDGTVESKRYSVVFTSQ